MLVDRLGLNLSRKSVVRSTDRLDMTIIVDRDVEQQNQQTYGPRQANSVLIVYASSEGSGEPAHPHSLARTFAARSYKQ